MLVNEILILLTTSSSSSTLPKTWTGKEIEVTWLSRRLDQLFNNYADSQICGMLSLQKSDAWNFGWADGGRRGEMKTRKRPSDPNPCSRWDGHLAPVPAIEMDSSFLYVRKSEAPFADRVTVAFPAYRTNRLSKPFFFSNPGSGDLEYLFHFVFVFSLPLRTCIEYVNIKLHA